MVCWSICARCLVKFRKWLSQRESSPTSPQTGRIDRDPRLEESPMVEDRFLNRLRKKARKGLRGWPIATVAFYGPNLSQATKVAVGILPPRIVSAQQSFEAFQLQREKPGES